jgi:RimJ/RimL family protein N-acetyltransferase
VILFARRTRDLKTARLRLVAITPAMLAADEAADGSLSNLLRANVTPEWPPEHWEPHVYHFIRKQYEDEPRTRGWHRYVLLGEKGRHVLIGAVGGFPKPQGDTEIGYSTIPSFQRKGYGTEAARALVVWLLTQKDVKSVSAQTYPSLPESIKVMERCGMTYVGAGDDEGTVRYRRMRQATAG